MALWSVAFLGLRPLASLVDGARARSACGPQGRARGAGASRCVLRTALTAQLCVGLRLGYAAVRRLALLLIAVALVGCGGSSKNTTTTNAAAPPGPGTTLYAGGDWAVVLDGSHVMAFHRVAGTWKSDTSDAVKIRILAPDGNVAPTPQVAAELVQRSGR